MKVEMADRRNSAKYPPGKNEGPFDVYIEDGKTMRHMRSFDQEAMENFNAKVMDWGSQTRAALSSSISGAGIGGSELRRSIRNNYKKEYGEIYRIGFSFKREGVFIEKGVGRGYVMRGGQVVKISKNPAGSRLPRPWFNRVIDANLPGLEQIVFEYAEKAIINTVRIYIR